LEGLTDVFDGTDRYNNGLTEHGIRNSICNRINVRLHCFGRTFLQSIRGSCKMESTSVPQQ